MALCAARAIVPAMTRIAVLSYDFSGERIHDAKALVWKLARDKEETGAQVLIICWSKKRESFALSDKISVESFPAFAGNFRPLYDFLFIFIAPYSLRKRGYKPERIVIADFPLAWGAWTARLFTGGEIVLRLQGLPRELGKTRGNFHGWYHSINEFLTRRIPNRYEAIGETTREYLLRLGVPATRIKMLTLDTIGQDAASIDRAKRGEARKKWDIPENAKILLSVGRLEPEKGFERLIAAFAKADIVHVHLVIAGGGKLLEPLKELAREKGASERVHFVGHVGRDDMWNLYADADAFALLSLSEGMPNVVLEAMRMEVPVIVSGAGGLLEQIGQKGERGFLFRPTDAATVFAEELERCFKKDEGVRAMIARARAYVDERGKLGA